MRSSDIFREYIWLVETIRRDGPLSLKELSKKWETCSFSEGRPLSRTTFNRHREAVERMFGIAIGCNRSTKEYHVLADDPSGRDMVRDWLVTAISLNNLASDCADLQERILLDNPPVGNDTLETILRAMRENRCVHVTYQRYGKEERPHTLAPYCVRMFQQRWYVLGRVGDCFRIFSFDRIKSCKLTNAPFAYDTSFRPTEYFSEYFGILTDSSVDCQRIVIRAEGRQRHYLRDLPLHKSQRLLEEGSDYTDFELFLRPTSDFLAALFSRAGWIRVLSPASLNAVLLTWAENMVGKLSELPARKKG